VVVYCVKASEKEVKGRGNNTPADNNVSLEIWLFQFLCPLNLVQSPFSQQVFLGTLGIYFKSKQYFFGKKFKHGFSSTL
jgi:hypothetical protein